MDVGLVVAGVIVVLAMVGISVYGARVLPPGSQVPLHHGIGGYNNWQPKTTALIAYPVLGAVVYAIMLVATSGASSSGKTETAVIAPIVTVIVAVSEYGAVRAAIRQNGRTGE